MSSRTKVKLLKVIPLTGMMLCLILILLSSTVSAGGLGLVPRKIIIDDALRGNEYERGLTILNVLNTPLTVSLNASGDAGSWISFYEADNYITPGKTITIPGNSTMILLKIKIPEDAANGPHNATISVESGSGTVEEGSGVILGINAVVSLNVTGTQNLTGIVKYIKTQDTEINYPLRIQLEFENTGNVVAQPEINTFISKDGASVASFTYAKAEIKPGVADLILVEWDTTGMEAGNYSANVTVSLGNEVLETQELPFMLLPIGTLTRQGVLADLSYEGRPEVGILVKILAPFVNTGEIDTKAKFIGEVYVNGDLIETINSEELLVPVGKTVTLTAYLKMEKSSYLIKGHALYDGKVTDTKELSVEVGKTASESKTLKKPSIPGYEGIEAASLASVIGYLLVQIRKRGGLKV